MIIGSLPNANRNNLLAAITDTASGVSTEALTDTDQGFHFTFHGGTGLTEGEDDLPNVLFVAAGLMERSGTDGPWSFTVADCAISVEWTRQTPVDGFFQYSGLPGTVTEIWRSFGVEIPPIAPKIGGRLNVDVGYSRPGPRYSLKLNGANYEGWVDYGLGEVPRAIVSAPSGGFPFPLRLVMMLEGAGLPSVPAEIADVMLEGQIGQKALLSAENKTEWGVTDLHLRIRQLGVVPGAPVDIDL